MKKQRGKDAITRIHVFISSIPEEKLYLYGESDDLIIEDSKFSSDSLSHKSVSVEEVSPEEWTMKMYPPDIISRQELLFVRPGYTPCE